jgi:parallel beta-helix repeat protein
MTTYYVSSEIGNDNNAGTSATAPLATLQAAANQVKPGDTVEVMNGTYTGPVYGDVLDITTSGTASAPITFEAAPGQTPVINSSGCWNAINIKASYIIVNGFTVVGDAANYTLQTALAGYSTGNANLDGNGIAINPTTTVPVPNHITIENNTVYNEPGGGIYTEGADYVQILNNVVRNNANWSAFGNSGISVSTSANSDTNPGVHDIISGNFVYNNAQLVPTNGGNTITDGEGIILDTNPGFVGEILVQNNTVYGNGGPGIEAFLTDNAVITGNTIYGNNTQNVQAPSNAQIFINQSNNVTVTNNIFNPNDHTPPNPPVITGDTVDINAVTLTGTAEPNSTINVYDNSAQLPGSATTDANGQWIFTTGLLANGSQSFTATATDAGLNVSQPSSPPFVINVNAPPNLVVNGSFQADSFDGWTLSGNYGQSTYGPQVFIDTNAESGRYAAGMGSIGSDGILSQSIATTPGQQYTVSFWLQNEGGGPNDFTAKWNGQALLALTNSAAFGYTEYTYTVTATGSTTTLEFDARQDPSRWDLDNISVTPIGTQPPATAVTQVVESPSSGDLDTGKTVTLTLNFNAPVTVTGTPTLSLNDNGIATYTGGSGSVLNFSYTVGSTDSNVSALAATGVNLPNSATITDAGGNAANLSLTGLTQTGPQIDTTIPTVSSVAESPSSGVLNVGNTVTLTLNLSEVVTVTGTPTPTLTLNDGGIATYTDGSGTSSLNFSYTVGSTDSNVPALAATRVNLPNGATVEDGGGNIANLSLSGLTQIGPQIDTTISDPDGPEAPVLTPTSPQALTVNAGSSVPFPPISVTAIDSDDTISVTISGLKRYESITDNLDGITFHPRHGSVTLTAAEVNSGLTLNSTYGGSGQPVNTLTVTAINSTAGETGTSAALTITVTDPPANSSTNVDGVTTLFAQTAAALLAQFGAAGFQNGTHNGGPVGAPLSQAHSTEDTQFLAKPHG